MQKKSNLKQLKEKNKKNIFKLIFEKGPITRAELTGASNLSLTAISDLVEELIQEKLVRESGMDISSGGRRPLLLEVNPEGGYVVALMITKDSIVISLYDISLELLDSQEYIIDYFDIPGIYAKLTACIESVNRNFEKQGRKLLGIGLCLSSEVEELEPRVVFSTSLNAEPIPLSQALSFYFRVPVFQEKYINIKATAEYARLNSIESMAYINFGENIQSAIIANGQFINIPVNVEHMIIDRNGPKCEEGHRGCLKAMASIRAIIKKAMVLMLENMDLSVLREGALTKFSLAEIYNPSILGESNLKILVKEVGDSIAICIVNLRNLLGIRSFSLSGEVIKLPGLIQWIKNSVKTLAEDVSVYVEKGEKISLLKQTAHLLLKNTMEGQVL
jgi:predicted NBD/HSP70 family sugar kinase